jgi:hypothetical protein
MVMKAIAHDFHLITSKEILEAQVKGWHYWEMSGMALWEVGKKISKEMSTA